MKTKNILILVLVGYYSLSVYSQIETQEKKQKKWLIGVNINTVEPITEIGFSYIVSQPTIFNDARSHRKDKSFSLGILIQYRYKGKNTLRLLSKVTHYNIHEKWLEKEITPAPTDIYLVDNGNIQQTTYTISPGIITEINYKKFNLYGGAQIVAKKYSATDISLRYQSYTIKNDSLTLDRLYTISESGGYSIGIGPIIGFTYSIYKNIFLGSEFSTAYTYYNRSGQTTWNMIFLYPHRDGGTIISPGSYESYKFSSFMASINIGINF